MIARSDTCWAFHFPGTTTFVVDRAGRIVCDPAPSAAKHTVRHLLIDQVIPLYLAGACRETVLHASAVALDTGNGMRAVLFIGDSGAGKSTTATVLTQLGATLLADDFALVGIRDGLHFVPPGGVGVRLWPETFGVISPSVPHLPVTDWHDKKRFLLQSTAHDCLQPLQLGAVVWLDGRREAGATFKLEPVGLARATALLLDQSYRPDTVTAEANAYTLQRVVEIVEAVPVVRVALPHSLATIELMGAQLLTTLRTLVADCALTP